MQVFYCTEVLCMQDHRCTHLAIKERQIAREYLAIHDHQIASMSYQTNYSKKEYFVCVLSHTWDISIYGIFCFLLTYVSHIFSYHVGFFYCTEVLFMQDHRHTHLAIKECPIASEYLAIHDRQIAIAHLTMNGERERQMTSNYLAMPKLP